MLTVLTNKKQNGNQAKELNKQTNKQKKRTNTIEKKRVAWISILDPRSGPGVALVAFPKS